MSLQDDEQFFEALFNEYAPGLVVMAQRMLRQEHAAQDIVHDVFVKLWGQREPLERAGARAYLFRAVRNRCLNHLEHGRIVRGYEHKALQPGSLGNLPGTLGEEYYVYSELSAHIEAALEHLTPQQRRIFTMNRFEGKTTTDIAAALDISPRTVQKHMELALRTLRHELADYLPLLIWLLV